MEAAKSTIKNIEAFIELIKTRLTDTDCPGSEIEKLERSAILSAIDCRLKYLNSMKKDERHLSDLERIMKVCAEHGFVPQYEISGKPPISIGRPIISPDSSMTACIIGDTRQPYSYVPLWLTNDMDLAVMKIPTEGNVRNVQFSPDASKIAIIQGPLEGTGKITIWDIIEVRILHIGDFPKEQTPGAWSKEGDEYAFFSEKGIEYIILEEEAASEWVEDPPYHGGKNMCFDEIGNKMAIVRRDGIAIISPHGTLNYKLPISYPENAVMQYDGDVLYVLADGRIIKIDEKIETIEIDDSVMPELCLFDRDPNRARLSFDGNLNIWFDSPSGSPMISVDLKKNRMVIPPSGHNGNDALKSEIIARLRSLKKSSSFPFGRTAVSFYLDEPDLLLPQKKGDKIFISENERLIVGYELVSHGPNYAKYNYREYNIVNGLLPNEYRNSAIVSNELMSKFSGAVEFAQGGFHISPWSGLDLYLKRANPDLEIYIRQSGPPLTIDCTMLDTMDYDNIEREINGPFCYLNKLEKEGEAIFTADAYWRWGNINSGELEQRRVRMIIRKDGISFIPLPSKGFVRSDTVEVFHTVGEFLWLIDHEGKEHLVATSDWVRNVKWITENKKVFAFICWDPKEKMTVKVVDKDGNNVKDLNNLKPCSDSALCLSDDEVFCMQEDAIVVADLFGNVTKTIDLNELFGWVVSGPPYKGHKHTYVPLLKAEMITEKYEERTTQHVVNFRHPESDPSSPPRITSHTVRVMHARLEMDTAKIDIFSSNQILDHIPTWPLVSRSSGELRSQSIDVSKSMAVCKQTIVSIGGGNRKKLVKWAIEKDRLREGKNHSEEENYLDFNITPLIGSNNYVVSTTGRDPDEKGRSERRPLIKIMDSASGRMIKDEENPNQSSVICGQVGYGISKGSTRAFSLGDGNYFVSELMGERWGATGPDVILSSWDVRGRRWPSDDHPHIHGKLLHKIDEDTFRAICGTGSTTSMICVINKTMEIMKKDEIDIPFIDLSRYENPNYEVMIKKVPQIKMLIEKNGEVWYSNLIQRAVLYWEQKNESEKKRITNLTAERETVLKDIPLILPVAVKHISHDSALPRIMPLKAWSLFMPESSQKENNTEYVLVEMDVILATLSCGMIINPVSVTLPFADNVYFGEDKLFDICEEVDISLCEGGYAIKRIVQSNVEEVPEEMKRITTLVSFDGKVTECEWIMPLKEKSEQGQDANSYKLLNSDEIVQLEEGILVKTMGQLIKYYI